MLVVFIKLKYLFESILSIKYYTIINLRTMNTTTNPFLNPDPKCSFLKKVNPYCIQVYYVAKSCANMVKPYATMAYNAFWIYANLYDEFQKKYNIHKHLALLAEDLKEQFALMAEDLIDFAQPFLCLFTIAFYIIAYLLVMSLAVALFGK